jgi:hypothetical protein
MHFVRVCQAIFGTISLVLGLVTLDALRYVFQNHIILGITGTAFLSIGSLFLYLATKKEI